MKSLRAEVRNYYILVAIFIATSIFITKAFLIGIVWGVIMAVSLWPIFDKFSQQEVRIGKYCLIHKEAQNNALLLTFLFSICFLTPTFYGILQLGDLYGLISTYFSESLSKNGVLVAPEWFAKLPPFFASHLTEFWQDKIGTSQRLGQLVTQIQAEKMFSVFSLLWNQIMDRMLTVVVMIVTLYFMIRNGNKVQMHYEQVFSFWFSKRSIPYIQQGVLALRGTINGILLIGVIEGVLVGIPLMLGGIRSGLIIGLIAGIAGVIPFVLPIMVTPFILYLFFTGDTLWGIISAIVLGVVWFIFEHFTKPQMISKYVSINTWLTFIAMVGGMEIFGLVGLFLGPAIIAMATGMIKELIRTPLMEEDNENHNNAQTAFSSDTQKTSQD